jgi:histidinol phosphatase-like enzyme (inositol monophosphatase family)
LAGELDAALDAAVEAGDLALKYFRAGVGVERKADESPVTRADREGESLIRERLSAAFPSYGILGEEFGETAGDSETRWIIDPIDGTKSFVYGVPLFAVLIGLERGGKAVLGVASFPALGETLWAESGAGAFCNGEPIHVGNTAELKDALFVCGSPGSFAARGSSRAFLSIASKAYATRTWGDAYGHCMVARGKADVMLDPLVNVWDTCALAPIVTEAGGVFTDWNGRFGHDFGEQLSSSRLLLPQVLSLLEVS